MLVCTALLAALPILGLMAQDSSGVVDADGMWTHSTPPDIGVDVTEATKGSTYRASATIQLRRGEITIPKAEGITWGFGDLPCGYGWDIEFPNGTVVCFNEDNGTVARRNRNPLDDDLVSQILRQSTRYSDIGEWRR